MGGRLTTALIAVALGLAGASVARGSASGKTTICHRTPGGKTPYVRLRVSGAALERHLLHPADIVPAPAGPCPKVVLSPTRGGRILTATLNGVSAGGGGAPDGTGTAVFHLRRGEGRICYRLSVAGITLPPFAAHIHQAPAGVNGPVVVGLVPPGADGLSSGCVPVERTLVAAILAHPAGYYANVHVGSYPGLSIRGQLTPA